MDLQLSAAHLRFRNELRAWLATNLPRPWREDLLLQAREDARAALRVDGEPARAGARRGGALVCRPETPSRVGDGQRACGVGGSCAGRAAAGEAGAADLAERERVAGDDLSTARRMQTPE